MIKINLLPTKRKPPKKLTELQQQLILGVLLLTVTVGGIAFFWMKLTSQAAELQDKVNTAIATAADQKKKLEKVANVEDDRKRVLEKIGVIEQLKKNQSGPVKLLDKVSRALPKGVNLTALAENAGQVSADGTAFSNNEVVRFVDNLKADRFFSEVLLIESRQAKIDGLDLYQYKLQFRFKGE
jgi:type IV pilus assembly protein PilN